MEIQQLENVWVSTKIFLHLPFPLSNHYYKGIRISMKKNWLCKTCRHIFDLHPWKDYKALSPHQLACPKCGSHSIYWSTESFKEIVDKAKNKMQYGC